MIPLLHEFIPIHDSIEFVLVITCEGGGGGGEFGVNYPSAFFKILKLDF